MTGVVTGVLLAPMGKRRSTERGGVRALKSGAAAALRVYGGREDFELSSDGFGSPVRGLRHDRTMKQRSMRYLIQSFMEKILPSGFLSLVEEKGKACTIKVGTKDRLLFATTVHHPTALLSQRFQRTLRESLGTKLNMSTVNFALLHRMKRFEFKAKTAKEKKIARFVNAYEAQKRETDSNQLRAEAKARGTAKNSRKAVGFE